jgi:hypothetical protein
MLRRAIFRRPRLQLAAKDADHRHRRCARGTARCKDSNFMESSRLRYSMIGRTPTAFGSMFTGGVRTLSMLSCDPYDERTLRAQAIP